MKKGRSTIVFDHPPTALGFAAVAGTKEAEGPFGSKFDKIYEDEMMGEKSFEKAESLMQKEVAEIALEKAGLKPQDIDVSFAGDLLNQCIGSHYGMRALEIPFAGLYGACSTMAESMILASLFIEGGFSKHTLAATSSHFCSSERQFRFPLEYGGQRPPTSQWTVTAAGCVVLSEMEHAPYVRAVTIGKIVDMGITDMNHMGAAMAPAAADTLYVYFNDTQTTPNDYDLILSGDLGTLGSDLLRQLLSIEGIHISQQHQDCGAMIYDIKNQDVHAGGSGCGCAAAVLCADILEKLQRKELKNVLFMATGALMSPISNQQGESIPSVAHLLHLSCESGKGGK